MANKNNTQKHNKQTNKVIEKGEKGEGGHFKEMKKRFLWSLNAHPENIHPELKGVRSSVAMEMPWCWGPGRGVPFF